MKAHKASKTAQYMALFRAVETARGRNRPLFQDPYARRFLSRDLRMVASLSSLPVGRELIPWLIQKKSPGALSSGVARTRYIDDLLEETVRGGARQIIILGAGFDARGLRLDFLRNTEVIEIDHPDTSQFKIERLTSIMGKLPGNISYRQADFNEQSMEEIGAASNVDYGKATTIVWEGVTNYISPRAVDATFRWTERFSRVDVIFTYLDKRVLDHPEEFVGTRKILKYTRDREEPWTFGFVPGELADYLGGYCLGLVHNVSAVEYRSTYMAHRTGTKGYEFYRVALARSREMKGEA